VITHTSEYMKNLDVLKAYTAHNIFRGRAMFTQDTVEVRLKGILVSVGNSPLCTCDQGNSSFRRLKPFRTERVHSERDLLLKVVQGKLNVQW